jgi:hypothetical protein
MAAIIATIVPFPSDVHIAFQAYIQSPEYVNRERIPYSKWRQMHIFLDNPALKPENPTDSNLKHELLLNSNLSIIGSTDFLIKPIRNRDMWFQKVRLLILLPISIYSFSMLAETRF